MLQEESGASQPNKQRLYGACNITPTMVVAFDACKISNKYEVHILIAIAEALADGAACLFTNRSKLRWSMQQTAEEKFLTLKMAFGNYKLWMGVVHRHGKFWASLAGAETVNRCAILVTGWYTEQLLGVSVVANSTANKKAAAVYLSSEHSSEHCSYESVKKVILVIDAAGRGYKIITDNLSVKIIHFYQKWTSNTILVPS